MPIREIDGSVCGNLTVYAASCVIRKPHLCCLNVLACPQLRGLEIEARAIVPLASLTTIDHLVGLSRGGILHAVFPRCSLLVNGGNSKGLVAGRLLAQCHLPFLNRHIVGLHHVRQFSDGLFLGLFPFHLFIFVSEVLNYLKLKKLKTLANAQPFFTLNS